MSSPRFTNFEVDFKGDIEKLTNKLINTIIKAYNTAINDCVEDTSDLYVFLNLNYTDTEAIVIELRKWSGTAIYEIFYTDKSIEYASEELLTNGGAPIKWLEAGNLLEWLRDILLMATIALHKKKGVLKDE